MARRNVLNVIPKGPLKIWLTLILPSTHKALGPVGGDSEAKLDQAEADSLDYLGSPPPKTCISVWSLLSPPHRLYSQTGFPEPPEVGFQLLETRGSGGSSGPSNALIKYLLNKRKTDGKESHSDCRMPEDTPSNFKELVDLKC